MKYLAFFLTAGMIALGGCSMKPEVSHEKIAESRKQETQDNVKKIDIKDLPADFELWMRTNREEIKNTLMVDYLNAKDNRYVRAVYFILDKSFIDGKISHLVSDPIYFAEDLNHDNLFSEDEFRIVTGTETYKIMKEAK